MRRFTLSRTLAGLCWPATTATCYRGLRGTLRVRSSLAWLRAHERDGTPPAPPGDSPHFVLLLPMLREQRIIADTVAAFCDLARAHPKTSVVLVTTERERAERDQDSEKQYRAGRPWHERSDLADRGEQLGDGVLGGHGVVNDCGVHRPALRSLRIPVWRTTALTASWMRCAGPRR